MNIILIGMRGSGKSTIGRLLASVLKMDFVDLDQEIAHHAGQTITEIVASGGWPAFRKLESEAARGVTKRDSMVLATGGGIVEREANVRALAASGSLVWLCADADTLYARIAAEAGRPPLTDSDPATEIRTVLANREPLYAAAADLRIETGGRAAPEIVKEIIDRLIPGGAN
jgi:shikimate kinase